MKKLYVLILAILLIAVGCSSNSDVSKEKESVKTENSSFPITIEDATGEKVTIEEKPERIVSLIPSNTEISYALGLGDNIVGVSDYDNYPEDVSEKEKIGGLEINTEKIIALAPDLILANSSSTPEGLQQLKDTGLTVVMINEATNFEQVYQTIEMIGKATGTKDKADEIVQGMKTSLAKIIEKAEEIKPDNQKKVFIEVMPAPEIFTTGKKTFMDEILTMIHAENAAKDHEGWVKMNEEAIIAMNPDVIITTYGFYTDDPVGKLLSRDGWQDIEAVKSKQVIDVHSDLVTRPGPRLIEGVETIAKAVYPEIFAQ